MRYKKASYMPTLMLHTAVAMKKTGDTKNANMFFNALIQKYPNSKEAKSAKKYLQ
jgi:TolA-binding protein